ncbi:hypothetical protein SCYAM73S_08480 [Streptomyces cyaneofuscatus]
MPLLRRVSRSSLHRQVKGGSLSHEDEKFSYVVATRFPATPAPARITRKPPLQGQVLLELCTRDDGLARSTVTKRHGELYRAARDIAWATPGRRRAGRANPQLLRAALHAAAALEQLAQVHQGQI